MQGSAPKSRAEPLPVGETGGSAVKLGAGEGDHLIFVEAVRPVPTRSKKIGDTTAPGLTA